MPETGPITRAEIIITTGIIIIKKRAIVYYSSVRVGDYHGRALSDRTLPLGMGTGSCGAMDRNTVWTAGAIAG